MMARLAAAIAALALLFAAPPTASGQGYTVLGFDDYLSLTPYQGLYLNRGVGFTWTKGFTCRTGSSSMVLNGSGRANTPNRHALWVPCWATMTLTFTTPQTTVGAWVQPSGEVFPANTITIAAYDARPATPVLVGAATLDPAPRDYAPLGVATTDATARITRVVFSSGRESIFLDDVTFAATAQPKTTIVSGPPALTRFSTAGFSFTSTAPEQPSYQCAVDGAPYGPCGSSFTVGVGDGAHTLQVRSIDGFGTVETSPPSYSWQTDLMAPDTTITGGPPSTTTATSAELTFRSPAADIDHFECRSNLGAWTACSSPLSLSELALGDHRLDVRAIDHAGNADTSPATRAWTVTPTPSPTPTATPSETAIAEPTPVLAAEAPRSSTRPDRDGDGVTDVADNCPAQANTAQGDFDHDAIGDACETLATVPPLRGASVQIRLLAGSSTAQLPDGRTVALSGVVSVPVGTTIDARDGRIAIEAANARRATVHGGPFRISERRGGSVDLELRASSRSRCRRSSTLSALSIDATASFRTVDALLTVSGRRAKWTLAARCDGTRITVQRGSVTLTTGKSTRSARLSAGRARLIRAERRGR